MEEQTGVGVAVAVLRDAYPSKDFPDRSVRLYAQMLADLDDRLIVEAVQRIVHRSKFLPTIAEIREEVAEAVLALPFPHEAWDQVNDERMVNRLPAVVMASLKAIGGRWGLRSSDAPQFLRSQFEKDYAARRLRVLHEEMGAAVPTVAKIAPSALAALPESTSIRERPIAARLALRASGVEPGAPTHEEITDAIRVLKVGDSGDPDDLYLEAERLMFDHGK